MVQIKLTAVLNYGIFCALCSFFATKVAVSFVKLKEEKIGVAKKGIREKHIRFPSISICFQEKASSTSSPGFTNLRPLDEIIDKVKYTRHHDNG